MERIGVRELRQHASRYLERVARGEELEVTDRGRPVAHLVPVRADPWEAMVASGRVTLAVDPAEVTDEPPGDYAVEPSAVLAAMRSEER
jgi:prevent-host-death family protein